MVFLMDPKVSFKTTFAMIWQYIIPKFQPQFGKVNVLINVYNKFLTPCEQVFFSTMVNCEQQDLSLSLKMIGNISYNVKALYGFMDTG